MYREMGTWWIRSIMERVIPRSRVVGSWIQCQIYWRTNCERAFRWNPHVIRWAFFVCVQENANWVVSDWLVLDLDINKKYFDYYSYSQEINRIRRFSELGIKSLEATMILSLTMGGTQTARLRIPLTFCGPKSRKGGCTSSKVCRYSVLLHSICVIGNSPRVRLLIRLIYWSCMWICCIRNSIWWWAIKKIIGETLQNVTGSSWARCWQIGLNSYSNLRFEKHQRYTQLKSYITLSILYQTNSASYIVRSRLVCSEKVHTLSTKSLQKLHCVDQMCDLLHRKTLDYAVILLQCSWNPYDHRCKKLMLSELCAHQDFSDIKIHPMNYFEKNTVNARCNDDDRRLWPGPPKDCRAIFIVETVPIANSLHLTFQGLIYNFEHAKNVCVNWRVMNKTQLLCRLLVKPSFRGEDEVEADVATTANPEEHQEAVEETM